MIDIGTFFRDAMNLMRSHDSQKQEDGFQTLLVLAPGYIDDLIEEFQSERDDVGLRRWLLELIAEAHSEKAFRILAEQLHSSDESLWRWANYGLRNLEGKEARRILWEWRQESPNSKS